MTTTLPIIRPRHRTRRATTCEATAPERRGLERAVYDASLWELMVGRVDVTDMTSFGATHFAGLVMGA